MYRILQSICYDNLLLMLCARKKPETRKILQETFIRAFRIFFVYNIRYVSITYPLLQAIY